MWWKIVLLVLLVAVVGVVVSAGIGSLNWKSRTRSLLKRLDSHRAPVSLPVYDPTQLEGLPAPVRRYFHAVLKPGQSMVSGVEVRHSGTFNMKEEGEQWKPFSSLQKVTTQPPGFLWNARIFIMPGLAARVHDAYVAGSGILHASILGLVSVANPESTPELARGELMRWCAEASWYPTALLPGQGVTWKEVDKDNAMALFRLDGIEVGLTFHFNEQGLIDSVRSEDRERIVNGESIRTPWEGRFWNYARRGGMQVPLDGEAAWITPSGRKPYWRGRIESLEYSADYTQIIMD